MPIATLPGAWERTLTISSGGKTFSTTGWKIGWVTGPADLVDAVLAVKQFLTYVNGSPVPAGDRRPGCGCPTRSSAASPRRCAAKRDLLGAGLRAAGFDVSTPSGSYFTVADAAPLGATDAAAFCRELPAPRGRRRDPAHRVRDARSAEREYATLVRFAACKRVEVLEEAASRLAARLTPADAQSRGTTRQPAQRERRIDPPHPRRPRRDRGARRRRRSPCRRHASSTPCGSTIIECPTPSGGGWSAAATKTVFSIARAWSERAPVVLLERTAHPLGRHEEHVGAGVREQPPHLGEAQVVAGHEPEPQAVELEGLGLAELARLDPVGLALPERVVEMQLAVAREHARCRRRRPRRCARACRRRPARASPATMCTPCSAAIADELGDERPVDVLRVLGERLVEGVDEVARVLGEHHERGRPDRMPSPRARAIVARFAAVSAVGANCATAIASVRGRSSAASLARGAARMTAGATTHRHDDEQRRARRTRSTRRRCPTTTSKTNATTPTSEQRHGQRAR